MLLYFTILLYVLKVSADVTVETTHGKISGKVFNTLIKKNQYYGFMGIPYAAPPVKDLRFRPPQNIEPWNKTLTANKEKRACVQFNTNILKGHRLGQYGVEDCLYLDIFTPGLDRNKRAVIMFLHNARFQNSYNKTQDYGPDFFIDEDVIVVTISHRLSVFGFLSLDNSIVPGNAGLRDIVAGLEWIAQNIKYFGGDPYKITLLGSNGGAAAVDLLLNTIARKHINSAILQSGTSLNPIYLQENVAERAFQIGKLLNISTSNKDYLLEKLNEISASDLLSVELKANPTEYYKENQRGVLTFGPIVEKNPDGLLTSLPEDSLEKIDIPIMIGYNSREGLVPSLTYLTRPTDLRYLQKDFPLLMPIRVKFKFDPFQEGYYEAIEDIRKFYFPETKITESSMKDYVTYIGDVLTTYPVNKMADHYSNITSSVYYYRFDYYGGLNENKDNVLKMSYVEEGTWGAATGDELCYLFKCPRLKDKYKSYERLKSKEMIIQSKLIRMWANFAKFGNPTPDENNPLDIKWPAYTLEKKQYLNIDNKFVVKRNLLEERFKFWDTFLKKWEKRAVNGLIGNSNKNDEL